MSGGLRPVVVLAEWLLADLRLMRLDAAVLRAVMERMEATASVLLSELRAMNRVPDAAPEGIS